MERRGDAREIDRVVNLLKNGRWHSLEEVVRRAQLDEIQTLRIMDFLANYNFVTFDVSKKRVKVTDEVNRFLKED